MVSLKERGELKGEVATWRALAGDTELLEAAKLLSVWRLQEAPSCHMYLLARAIS